MPISFDRAFSIHDDALVLRGRRSSILASNIANVDTPNYKARDIDFGAMLSSASQQQSDRVVLASTHREHISTGSTLAQPELKYRNPLHPSLDGNSVDAHVEQAKFAENAMLYQTSFTFLNGKVNGLMKALKGE
ncbi:MAG: flagellar basal body rod protein FlgB [Gammaproteobacteria bacterium]|nr:flagellar basal body rod protein FlgB [Gammaproteobacteria bacterium]